MIFADFLGLGLVALLLVLLIGLAILVFEVAMFIDVILNKNISDEAKILWVIGMLLLHPFIAIAYYFTDHKKRT
jgi:phosphotransferase system  glucose/maltose/N-acetylglucosamine-specific IIC component